MKKETNSEVSSVEIIVHSWQFIIVAITSSPHGTRWPKFYHVQVIEAVTAVAK